MTKQKKKHDKGATSPTEQDLAPENTPSVDKESAPSNKDIKNDVRAQREARRGKGAKAAAAPQSESSAPEGYVRKSTMYFSAVLALALGLMMGSLLPGLNAPVHTTQSAGQAGGQAAQKAPDPAKQKELEERTAQLAKHILETEEIIRKNPQDVEALIQLGNLYFDTGKAMSSIQAYERALLIKPNNANVLTDLGIMYREAGQFEMAVQSFRKAIAVDPKHQNALFNNGVVLFFDLQRKDEARKTWQALLAVNPQAKAPDGKLLKDLLRDLK